MKVSEHVPHPQVPEWLSERTGSTDGEFKTWTTDHDVQPHKIVHNRDFMMSKEEVAQDYNFLDYYFGDPGDPVCARNYLGEPEVSVEPSRIGGTVPDEVILYLKKRFARITVLSDTGYNVVWDVGEK